jgi:threonine/homoserine/homoserine lactone efflux protein
MLLLFMPGPTNTLLATRGAQLGFRRALSGTLAEMSAYALTILMLRLVLEPIAARMPTVRILVQLTCASYLIFLSYRLWIGAQKGDNESVTWWRIFVTTVTNPKAFLFAFVILPRPTTNVMRTNVLNGLILLVLIALAGTVWTIIGALAVVRGPFNSARIIGRTASLVLLGFGLYMFVSAAEATGTSC